MFFYLLLTTVEVVFFLPMLDVKVIKNGTVVTLGRAFNADVLVRDGVVSGFSRKMPVPEGAEVIDASGCVVCQALADIHVHLREPGFSEKETIRTGTAAAARGGYGVVCAMPNLDPVPDSLRHLAVEQRIIDRDALIDVRPYCSITKGRQGLELVDFKALKGRCAAFSDDGSGVQDEAVMMSAMRAAAEQDVIIAAHCEDNSLLNGGYIHGGRYCALHGHKGICSKSEWGQIERDVRLCAAAGCRYHVCHISTAESVGIIRRAKAAGVKVTCETAPHYLVLCDDDLREEGRFKMNPPLRSFADREALLEGLLDGTIDAIATDHAPHTAEQKSKGLQGSAMGIVGLETAFPVVYTSLVRTGKTSIESLVSLMAERPRKIFRLGPSGLFEGARADIAIFDVAHSSVIDSSEFASMGRSTPFEGMEVYGRTRMTLIGGKKVYEDGKENI